MVIDTQAFVGRTILVGLTWCDNQGNVTEQQQILGTIFKVIEEENTVEVDRPSGEYWPLPFYPQAILYTFR